MADIEWHGDGAIDHVRRRAASWLNRAAITVTRRAKELLSIPGTAMGRNKATGRYARVYGAARSAPGEPPRKQAGYLREKVTYEVDDAALEARVGTNVPYGMYLELGTKKGLAPRPWLRRALAESMGQVQAFLAQMGGDR